MSRVTPAAARPPAASPVPLDGGPGSASTSGAQRGRQPANCPGQPAHHSRETSGPPSPGAHRQHDGRGGSEPEQRPLDPARDVGRRDRYGLSVLVDENPGGAIPDEPAAESRESKQHGASPRRQHASRVSRGFSEFVKDGHHGREPISAIENFPKPLSS